MTKLKAFLIACTMTLFALLPASSSAQSPTYNAVAPSNYWGYSYYPYGWGYAAALHAEGDYLIQRQHAKMAAQEVAQKRLETHRKELEHVAWTRNFDHEEFKKQRDRQVEYNRLWAYDQNLSTGQLVRALNLLLEDLSKQAELKSVQPVDVESSILKNISFALLHGNIGFLKQIDHLPWPLVLMDKAYAEDRQRIKQLLTEALQITLKGEMAVDQIKELDQVEGNLKPRVKQLWKDKQIDFNDYREANQLFHEIDDTVRVLKRPQETNFLMSDRPPGKNVVELVDSMASRGLHFADIPDGKEPYYSALYRLMLQQSKIVHGDK
jgi:hypothetical protein